jgi:hypothetical protein
MNLRKCNTIFVENTHLRYFEGNSVKITEILKNIFERVHKFVNV